jgi:hypothetical protein
MLSMQSIKEAVKLAKEPLITKIYLPEELLDMSNILKFNVMNKMPAKKPSKMPGKKGKKC